MFSCKQDGTRTVRSGGFFVIHVHHDLREDRLDRWLQDEDAVKCTVVTPFAVFYRELQGGS